MCFLFSFSVKEVKKIENCFKNIVNHKQKKIAILQCYGLPLKFNVHKCCFIKIVLPDTWKYNSKKMGLNAHHLSL